MGSDFGEVFMLLEFFFSFFRKMGLKIVIGVKVSLRRWTEVMRIGRVFGVGLGLYCGYYDIYGLFLGGCYYVF